jgi:polar amino acid transport system substrate-binding protein
MKQVEQNYRRGTLRVVDVPPPQMGPGSVLVSTTASVISSGTEKQLMELAKASLAGKAVARPDLVRQVLRSARREGLAATAQKVFAKLDVPIPMGYSIAGKVLEYGRDVHGLQVGDRVACAGSGLANHAEINSVPKNLVVPIPEHVTDEQASFVTLGAIALQGVRQAAPTLGETAVVMGLGLIGLLTVQLLKANGCRVIGFDPDSERASRARELGADLAVSDGLATAVDWFTNGVGADAVLITASTKSTEPVNVAGEISRLKGRVVVVGLVGMTLERDIFYKRELDLKLSLSYGPGRYDPEYEQSGHDYPLPYVRWTEQRNMQAFLNLVAEGRVTPEQLITHRFPIDRAEEAYDLIGRGEPHLALLLEYPDQPRRELDAVGDPKTGDKKQRHDGMGVGFIGLGNYAKAVLLPAVTKTPGINLKRVATATGISANSASERYGFESRCTDPEVVLSADDVGTVFIATRHNSHADYAAKALRNGKHVFVEKPLALDLDQLDQVVEAASGATGTLLVGFNRRFSPMLRMAREAIAKAPGPKVMLYRVNAGSIPADSWIRRNEGGGRIVGEMCHFVDALAFLCESAPKEVQAVSAAGLEDAISVLIRFADGSTGTIVYSSIGTPAVAKEYIEVFARDRAVQVDDFTRITVVDGSSRKTIKRKQDKGQAAMIEAFFRTIRESLDAPINLEELISVSEATFAIEQSLRTGLPVELGV